MTDPIPRLALVGEQADIAAARKILSRRELLERRAEARATGRRVVQCHGCFDIVHPGHIRHLRQAKAQGDILLVSITADEDVGKGAGRPLIPQELRAENLASLDFVDWVHVNPDQTAVSLLAVLKPDVYVKGREYESNDDPRFRAEREAVQKGGGRVVFSSGDVVFSSTALISALERSVDPYHARVAQLFDKPELSAPLLLGLISEFHSARAIVVGETVIESYVHCDRPEVAGEGPIMALRPIESRRFDGGAAMVARNLAALGAEPVLITALPRTDEADELRRRLASEGVDVRAIEVSEPVPERRRFLVGGQKVMRVDDVIPLTLDSGQQELLVELAAASAESRDCAIIADGGLGLLSAKVATRLCAAVRPRVGILAGKDSDRRAMLSRMRGLDLACPSEAELRHATRLYDEGLPAAAWKLMQQTSARAVLVTLAEEGLIAFDRLESAGEAADGQAHRVSSEHVPAINPHKVDSLGCSSALLACATLAVARGAGALAAGLLAGVSSSIVGERLGAMPVTSTDLRRAISRLAASHLVYSPADIISSRAPAALSLVGHDGRDPAPDHGGGGAA